VGGVLFAEVFADLADGTFGFEQLLRAPGAPAGFAREVVRRIADERTDGSSRHRERPLGHASQSRKQSCGGEEQRRVANAPGPEQCHTGIVDGPWARLKAEPVSETATIQPPLGRLCPTLGGGFTLLKEFKTFLLRGNVIDLAVAVVIGAAFGAVITAFVTDFVTPLIAAIGGNQDFSALNFTINGSTFMYGHFINQLISFVLIAAVIFFLVIMPINALIARSRKEPPSDPTTTKCPECLSEIPIQARRCAFCTEVLSE